MRAVDRHLVDLPDRAIEILKELWPGEEIPANITLILDRLKEACRRIREWKWSAARAGVDAALRVACSWYDDLDLDALHTRRGDAPTNTDPAKTAKRQDRAYRIAEFAPVHLFIPLLPMSKMHFPMSRRKSSRKRKLKRPEKTTPLRKKLLLPRKLLRLMPPTI
jgi:hypothetical protein